MKTTEHPAVTVKSRLHRDVTEGMEIPDGALVLYLPNGLDGPDLERAITKGVEAVRAGRTVVFRYPDPDPELS